MGMTRRRAPRGGRDHLPGNEVGVVLQRRDDDLVVRPAGLPRPQLCATRLMASVVPRVKMISRVEAAFRKRRTRSRAPSKASVASWLSVCTPRCTLACRCVS